MDPLESKIRNKLKSVYFQDKSILEGSIIDSLEIKGTTAYLHLLLPSKTTNIQKLQDDISLNLIKLEEIEEVKFSVSSSKEEIKEKKETENLNTNQLHPENNNLLQNYKNIIAVASGKGGVGKSTVALNLALCLIDLGYKAALFDADIYGPSIPLMLGTRNIKPKLVGEKIIPLEKFALEYISIGNLISEGDSIVWRGPMVHQAVQQLMQNTTFSGGDFMIIDLPPGTGDIQISLSQITAITGAVIVSTPQDLALMDARRSMVMFEKVNIPILGIVENMSTFICPKCQSETAIFSSNGALEESKNLQFPFLGKIPLHPQIREGGDKGVPSFNKRKKRTQFK